MKRLVLISLLCALHAHVMFSQEKSFELNIDDSTTIEDSGVTISGNYYILQNGKGKEAVKTRYTLWDADLNVMLDYKDIDKFTSYDIDFTSNTGSNLILDIKKGYANIDGTKTKFSDDNLNGDIADSYYTDDLGRRNDVVQIKFLTDSEFIAIGRKEGKQAYKKGNVKEIEIFLYKKDLKTLEDQYQLLQLPTDNYFYSLGPKLIHYDSESFILSYVREPTDTKRTYINVVYDYNGKIITQATIEFKVEKEDDKFAVLNYGNGSFNGYRPLNMTTSNPFDHRTTLSYQLPTMNSKGALIYDKYEEVYYAYAGVNSKNKTSSLLFSKHTLDGQLVWKKSYPLEETQFAFMNSFNRFLTFDISSNFIGLSVFSTKGKNYCDFYIFEKQLGGLTKSRKFKDYKFYKSGKNYNGLYAQFMIQNEQYGNLIMDRNTLFSSIYSETFKNHLTELNTEGPHLIKAYYTADGVNIIRSSKEGKKLFFEKF
jgi:hypothetical protein